MTKWPVLLTEKKTCERIFLSTRKASQESSSYTSYFLWQKISLLNVLITHQVLWIILLGQFFLASWHLGGEIYAWYIFSCQRGICLLYIIHFLLRYIHYNMKALIQHALCIKKTHMHYAAWVLHQEKQYALCSMHFLLGLLVSLIWKHCIIYLQARIYYCHNACMLAHVFCWCHWCLIDGINPFNFFLL